MFPDAEVLKVVTATVTNPIFSVDEFPCEKVPAPARDEVAEKVPLLV